MVNAFNQDQKMVELNSLIRCVANRQRPKECAEFVPSKFVALRCDRSLECFNICHSYKMLA